MIKKILTVAMGVCLLAGCCTRPHYPPTVFMSPTQQELKAAMLQEQLMRDQLANEKALREKRETQLIFRKEANQ